MCLQPTIQQDIVMNEFEFLHECTDGTVKNPFKQQKAAEVLDSVD